MRILILCLLAASRVAHAQDEFEIQVYDTNTAAEGDVGVELHLNHHLIDGAKNQTHTTFEPHYGLRDWLELGAYLQGSEARGEHPEFAGFKLRVKARMPERYWGGRLALAINGELSIVPSQFEANVYGSEIRPIADLHAGHFYASINPIIGTDLGGSLAGHPQLEPCAKVAYYWDAVGFGLEGYGAFGPIDDLGSEEVERGFVVFDYVARTFDVNFGVGLTHGIGDHPIGKLIFGIHP